jgi:hypothetical protein
MQVRKTTIVFIELGMLGGIVLAGYTLPDNTPLWMFLVASVVMFVSGNALLLRRLKENSSSNEAVPTEFFWPRLFSVLAILAILWILGLMVRR